LVLLLGAAVPAVKAYQEPDASGVRSELAREARERPSDIGALTRYAEFLDRYGDPESRQAYRSLLAALGTSGDSARAAAITRRLARLDLLEGERGTAARDLDAYARAGGARIAVGDAAAPEEPWPTVAIPGPMRSFARMSALPPDADASNILAALARNVVTNGYRTGGATEALEPTEYLKLFHRYLSQARELQTLAGDRNKIRIEKCESPAVADLLRILGYRMRGGCGSEVVLETVNAARAFLTSDSGFPINKLEQALRTDRPFEYDYEPAAIPVVFGPGYWVSGAKGSSDFIEAFTSDPSICRLYMAFAKLDRETAESLRKAVPFARLKAYAHVLDFYGGLFEIRGGKAITPGGARSAAAWTELVGASPDQGPQFLEKLAAKDDGWMASLYDALARIHGQAADYLTEPARMKRFYAAIKGRVTTPGPARPVFRANADMMLLTTRLRFDADGQPHIPGSLEVWKNVFVKNPLGKYDIKLTRQAPSWKEPDDLLEALFALCRKNVENQPLKVFMAISDVDRNRAEPLDAAVVDRLVRQYSSYSAQYAYFSDSSSVSGKSIGEFLDAADAISRIRDPLLRSDAAGMFQGLSGLWEILVRQGNIRDSQAGAALGSMAGGFVQVHNDREALDAGLKGVNSLVAAGRGAGHDAAASGESLLDLLAGGGASAGSDAHDALADRLAGVLEAQRIVPVDTLIQLAGRLDAMARGEKPDAAALGKLTGRLAEVELPRPPLSSTERNTQTLGNWPEKHIDAERSLNARQAVQKAGGDAEKLREIRGRLAPWLRDTLLGLNYAYYSPPGAQVLYANPLFVRNHDFIGAPGSAVDTWRRADVAATGWPSSGGGRLTGSLAGLPYALASAEQNFLVPTHTQALIWGDLAPQIMVGATLPRYWDVTPAQLHWVGLHLRYARELLAESAWDAGARAEVLDALAPMATPARLREAGQSLARGEAMETAQRLTPSELFWVARALAQTRQDDSCVLAELRELARSAPNEANYAAISRAFGTPKPTLTNSYRLELLNLRTFPTLMGYSSRILAESWESNTLYWAALADELYLAPADLNVRIPEWTGKLVEHIFASNLDDWPALLKSLRMVGEEERARSRGAGAAREAVLGESPNR